MMAARVTTGIRVSWLIKRVNAEGGSAMILHKGDPTAGALLLILCQKGENFRFFERVMGLDDDYQWRQIGLNLADDPEKMAEFLEKRRKIDPDLWIVELDVAQPERFIDESFMKG